MDVVVSAVASDLIGRFFSFLISRCQEPSAVADYGTRLQRALLRARIILEEAEGRQVTSLAMLLQLRELRWEMCRAAYALDALTIRSTEVASRRRHRKPQLLSFSDSPGSGMVVESLEAALGGVKELVVLLGSYPRLTRQPYSVYLFMERCMFGRQMEKEQIVDFLLRPACASAGDPNPGVLPVVGGRDVGKRTLVEHVCIDERVRQYFAKIHRLSSDDLTAGDDHGEHRRFGIDPSTRSLVVVDIVGDVEEEPWRRLCSSVRREDGDSKVVIICRKTEHATRLGTAPRPVTLDNLRRPELWYFFRALAFGGADPEDRPEMVAVAAEIFDATISLELSLFLDVSSVAALLRTDMTVRSWRRMVRVLGEVRRPRDGGGHEHYRGEKDDSYMFTPSMDAPRCLFYDMRKLARSSTRGGGDVDERLPMVTMKDLLTGHVVPGVDTPRFDVLVWESPIPPYCSYVRTCEMDMNQQVVLASGTGRKRVEKRWPHGNSEQDEWLKKKRLMDG